MIDCPEHGGGYDCTPFCKVCEGEQGYCPICEPIKEIEVEHNLNYYMSVANKYKTTVDENGNIVLSEDFDITDVTDTELYCLECDSEGLNLYEYHGVSREYEVR
jgi:hypothetical protein